MKTLLCASALMLASAPAWADLVVQFQEDAPKDRFVIRNVGPCAVLWVDLTIDLSGSPFGLVFDVTEAGAGVNVFQPFELTSGQEVVAGVPDVADGDTSLTLSLRGLGANRTVGFTIDLDDTAEISPSTVSSGEIAGATIRAEGDHGVSEASFGPDGTARLPMAACIS